MLSEKYFDVFSFMPGVYVGTFDLIASISGPSILIFSDTRKYLLSLLILMTQKFLTTSF